MSRVLSMSNIVMIRCIEQEHALSLCYLKAIKDKLGLDRGPSTKAEVQVPRPPSKSRSSVSLLSQLGVLDYNYHYLKFANWALCTNLPAIQ